MKIFKTTFFIVSTIFILISCNSDTSKKTGEKKEVSNIKYAKGFDIIKTGNETKLIIKTPYPDAKEETVYTIVSEKSNKKNTIQVPLNSIVVTSSTHVPALELLGVENKLVGFPNTDFISSIKTRKLIDKNLVKELGHPEQINTETLLDLDPDLVMGFAINSNNKMFSNIEKLGIQVVFNGDWLEETPIGRAEWIKFYGVLFDKEKESDSIFNKIKNNYLDAKAIALKSKNKPSIVCGGLYRDVWYLPAGESFEATFLKDANINYLWKDSKGQGSLSLNIENVFEKGKDADIWTSPGFYETLEDLEKANLVASKMKAFKNKSIYSYNNTKGEKGGIWYFELSPIRPDLVLKDLIKIAHPNLLPDYEFTFYKKLN
ncbi:MULTISPECIES: ABC transporter substrate-binding protein [Flavobacteriaceae]|uniref:ABC transporter substrate-binding protein n=2 Tax=Flavobacteriaceae TaxID=49546 RepID=A0A4Y8AXD6_9FLAO|nr:MULTISPECIES: ABC transporter substrate-binding protein [Flavobacteriaceae]TEW76658.1 ABC transporter substrate-binding protein [Gramella jeungdoensis]GGK51083.1 ABC transporter substrate-binding protein [Lutibacter litoralis]